MPLIKSRSKKAFKENLEAEIHAGKPLKQSLAIAYDVKRRTSPKKKMFTGGPVWANEQHPDMLKPDTALEDKEMPSIDMNPENDYMGSKHESKPKNHEYFDAKESMSDQPIENEYKRPVDESDKSKAEGNEYMGNESVADKIMRKHNALKKEMYEDADNMYAEGGLITDIADESDGQADYMENGKPAPRILNDRRREMMDENFNEPIEEASYPSIPSDKNPHDEDDDSIISRIRRKMMKK